MHKKQEAQKQGSADRLLSRDDFCASMFVSSSRQAPAAYQVAVHK